MIIIIFMNTAFLTLSYWFSLVPGELDSSAQRFFTLIFALVFIVGVVGKIFASNKVQDKLIARVYRKIGSLGITMGIFGFLMLFFFYQEIYLLNARFWFLLWLGVLVVWLWRVVHLARVKIPQIKKTLSEQQEFEKYLPKRG